MSVTVLPVFSKIGIGPTFQQQSGDFEMTVPEASMEWTSAGFGVWPVRERRVSSKEGAHTVLQAKNSGIYYTGVCQQQVLSG